MKVFIDTNILKFGVNSALRLAPNKFEYQLGGKTISLDLQNIVTVFPNESIKNNEELKSETMLLPKIAEYAKENKIDLIMQDEVLLEFWGLPGSYDPGANSCFDGIEIKTVESPLKYNNIFGGFGLKPTEDLQRRFLESITDKRFLQLQIACGAYQGKKKTHFNQLKDAFHVFCAESINAEYFLTCDLNLISHVKRHKKYPPKVKLVRPSELIEIVEDEKN